MEGLLEILSPANIMDMDDNLVTTIAAEPEEAQNERQLATEKLKVLEAGLQTCKRYVRRRPISMTLWSCICIFPETDSVVAANQKMKTSADIKVIA